MPTPDELANESQLIIYKLFDVRASLLTVSEIIWINQLETKHRWGTSVKTEQSILENLKRILDRIEDETKNTR